MADDRDKRFRAERGRRQRRLTAIQRDTGLEVTRLLRQSETEILATLAAQPSDYELWRLPELLSSVRAALVTFERDGGARVGLGMGQSWQAGIDLIDAPLAAGGAFISGLVNEVDPRQLLAMRTFATDRIKNISITAADRINGALGLTAIGAQTPSDAATRISAILGTGGVGGARGRAITIVRTELGRAFSVAADERMQAVVEVVPGLKHQWRRSGKRLSRITHDAADGQIRDIGQPFNVGGKTLRYPRDPRASAADTINCGCTALPYMEHWEMSVPGARPFTPAELGAQPLRRGLGAP